MLFFVDHTKQLTRQNMTEKATQGGTVIIDNVPKGVAFGIDYNAWYVGPNFRGISSIPDGFHFIFTSMVDHQQQHSPRNGQFIFLDDKCGKHGLLLQSAWDERNEEIVFPFNEISLESLSGNHAASLAPYPLNDAYEIWTKLTCFITNDTVARLVPLCGSISPLTQVDCTAELEKGEKQRLDLGEKSNVDFEELKIRFTVIPEKKYPNNASPSDITKYSMDNSFALDSLLSSIGSQNAEKELLAEIQFAFVCFMIGQVFDAFEHWKTIIRLICKCDEALCRRPNFFASFLDVIEFQIKEIPEDFFVDIVAEQNFLVQTLQILFSTIHESNNLDRRLIKKSEHLKEFLAKTFTWNFDLEDDEDLPVVVNEF